MNKLLIILYILIFLPWSAKATNVLFKIDSESLVVGKTYELKVFFDRENEEINAIEGQLTVPIPLVSDITIKDGNSAVSLWVQKPELTITKNTGIINFSAVSPSGINGLLFSILFVGREPGNGYFDFTGTMLLADGKGTKLPIKQQNFELSLKQASSSTEKLNEIVTDTEKDKTAPENFTILVARDPKIFDNKWFAVFNAQDKDSGIAFYEALETNKQDTPENQKTWEKTQSPHLFKNQNPPNFLYIKAVDKNGNYKIALWENPNKNPNNKEQNIKIYVIITIIILILLAIFFEIYLRKHKKQNLKF